MPTQHGLTNISDRPPTLLRQVVYRCTNDRGFFYPFWWPLFPGIPNHSLEPLPIGLVEPDFNFPGVKRGFFRFVP